MAVAIESTADLERSLRELCAAAADRFAAKVTKVVFDLGEDHAGAKGVFFTVLLRATGHVTASDAPYSWKQVAPIHEFLATQFYARMIDPFRNVYVRFEIDPRRGRTR